MPRLVSREGACLVIAGTLIGQAGALGLTSVLNAWFDRFYQITRTTTSDPLIVIGAPIVLAGFTMVSCYLPARRSLRIDSVTALRQE